MEEFENINTDYNALIYKHVDIFEKIENNFKSVICNTAIPRGTLIMLEHVLSVPSDIAHQIILNNRQLFNQYHPREIPFEGASPEERIALTTKKISHNCFGMDNMKILNAHIYSINHSCVCNCCVYIRHKETCEDAHLVFMEVYSIRDIPANTEITINYGSSNAHNRDFECKCGLELEERQKIEKISSRLVAHFGSDAINMTIVDNLIYRYLSGSLSKKIILNQHLAANGIFMSDNTIIGCTSKGTDIVNSAVCQHLGIENDDPITKTDKLTPQKIALFIKILNYGLSEGSKIE